MKILIYNSSDADNALGEQLLKIPLFRTLKQHFPDAIIDYIPCFGKTLGTGPLAAFFEPYVNKMITDIYFTRETKECWKRPKHALFQTYYDVIIDLQHMPQRSWLLWKVPHSRMISRSFGIIIQKPFPIKRKDRRVCGLLLRLANAAFPQIKSLAYGVDLPDNVKQLATELLPDGKSYIGIAPCGGLKSRGNCWPVDKHIALAQRVADAGHTPVFILGPNEMEEYNIIRESNAPGLITLDMPKFTEYGIPLTVALGERLTAAIANDSGTAHMLAASKVPMVTIYGPTNSKKYIPYSPISIAADSKIMNDTPDVNSITIDQAWEKLKPLLEAQK